jgi:adenine-specific DNA-methyltransferase
MGTKRQLAASVSEIVARSSPGPFLDVFSGMCAIATSVAPVRQIWTNDLQFFAHSVSFAHFRSRRKPPSRFDAVAWVSKAYSDHTHGHFAIASSRLNDEESALRAEDATRLNDVYRTWQEGPKLPKWERADGCDAHLFRDTFAGAFFGLSQSIEIDALRYAVDHAKNTGVIDGDTHRWLILALCVAMSKCSASTGHFAQPLTSALYVFR